jgi:hypothetical protein
VKKRRLDFTEPFGSVLVFSEVGSPLQAVQSRQEPNRRDSLQEVNITDHIDAVTFKCQSWNFIFRHTTPVSANAEPSVLPAKSKKK